MKSRFSMIIAVVLAMLLPLSSLAANTTTTVTTTTTVIGITIEQAQTGLAGATGATGTTGAWVQIDCNGYDGVWFSSEISAKGNTNLSFYYKVFDQLRNKWSTVEREDPVAHVWEPNLGYFDYAKDPTPGAYKPLPKNADKVQFIVAGCDGCLASLFLTLDDVSKSVGLSAFKMRSSQRGWQKGW